MSVAIYQIDNGEITGFIDCPYSMISLQVHDGEDFFLNCPRSSTHIIDNLPVTIVPEPITPDPPSVEQLVSAIDKAMENHYDAVARTKRYNDRITCSLRAGYPGPYQAEGIAFGTWMDTCNAYAYAERDKVLAGTRTMPTPDEAVAELPPMVWPT